MNLLSKLKITTFKPKDLGRKFISYMACSVSGQDELNPALRLATGTGYLVPQENTVLIAYNKSFIYQAC